MRSRQTDRLRTEPRWAAKAATALVVTAIALSGPLAFAGTAQDLLPPGGTFVDDDNNTHEGMIEAIVSLGITAGCDPQDLARYCPDESVTRAQMASFLMRALSLPPGPERFADDDGSVHEAGVNAVAAAGITLGCDPNDPVRFCPETPITRGQMAAFLQRAFELDPPSGTSTYIDDDGSSFETEIEAIAAAGITAGCSVAQPELFCPFDPVRRDQMATFLGRALDAAPNVPPRRTTAADRMVADVDTIVAFGPRVGGTEAETDAADWIHDELLSIVGNVTTTPVPLPNGSTSRNVSAIVGEGVPDIILGAHLDSVQGSVGADDNASGVAVVLELARTMAADPPDATVMVVAFGAEEVLPGFSSDNHHFGSRQLADDLADDGALPRFMISVDMVGLGDALFAVTYQGLVPEAANLLVEAGEDVDVAVTLMDRGDISDHEAFARQGVPAAFLWRPDNPAWHTPGDDTVRAGALVEDLAVLEQFLVLAVREMELPGGAD